MRSTATFGCPLICASGKPETIQRQKHKAQKTLEQNNRLDVGKYASFFKNLNDARDTFSTDLNRKINSLCMFYNSLFHCS